MANLGNKKKNWVRHPASFLETKSRQKSWVPGDKFDFLGDFLEYVQLEKAVGKDEKLESPKLESFTEVGKSQAKLEITEQSWKEPIEVGK